MFKKWRSNRKDRREKERCKHEWNYDEFASDMDVITTEIIPFRACRKCGDTEVLWEASRYDSE